MCCHFVPINLIRNVVIDDEICQNTVDENTIMLSVVTQVIMVPFVKRLGDCTMKSIWFIAKMGRLNFKYWSDGKILSKVQLNEFSVVDIFHHWKNSRAVFDIASMFFVFNTSTFDKAYMMLHGLSVIYTSSSLISLWFAFFSGMAFYDSLIWVKLACLIISFLKFFCLIKTINVLRQGIMWW